MWSREWGLQRKVTKEEGSWAAQLSANCRSNEVLPLERHSHAQQEGQEGEKEASMQGARGGEDEPGGGSRDEGARGGRAGRGGRGSMREEVAHQAACHAHQRQRQPAQTPPHPSDQAPCRLHPSARRLSRSNTPLQLPELAPTAPLPSFTLHMQPPQGYSCHFTTKALERLPMTLRLTHENPRQLPGVWIPK